MKHSTKTLVIGAALAGLLGGTAARAHDGHSKSASKAGHTKTAQSENGDKHSCKGQNSCKGKGGCASGDNGCKGKNSCEGKGGCSTEGGEKEDASS